VQRRQGVGGEAKPPPDSIGGGCARIASGEAFLEAKAFTEKGLIAMLEALRHPKSSFSSSRSLRRVGFQFQVWAQRCGIGAWRRTFHLGVAI